MATLAQFRIPLGMVTLTQNFSSLGCVTAVRRALKVFAKRYITLKNQSLQNGLKLIPQIVNQPPDFKNIKFDQYRSKLGKFI